MESVRPDPLRIEGVSGTDVYLLESGGCKEIPPINPINASSKEKLISEVDLYNVWDRPLFPDKMDIERDGKKFIELLDGATDGCNDTEDDKLSNRPSVMIQPQKITGRDATLKRITYPPSALEKYIQSTGG